VSGNRRLKHDRNANHTKANWHFTTPYANTLRPRSRMLLKVMKGGHLFDHLVGDGY
jgi:hypothetical protein